MGAVMAFFFRQTVGRQTGGTYCIHTLNLMQQVNVAHCLCYGLSMVKARGADKTIYPMALIVAALTPT
jgi:hypothetical protein